MNTFFKQMAATGIKRVSLELIFVGEELSVVVTPKSDLKDKSLSDLKPIVMRGSVEDMDQEFFNEISKPMISITELYSNVELVEKSIEEVDKNSDAKKKIKEQQDKEKKEKETKLEKAWKRLEAITTTEGYDAKKEKDKVLKALSEIEVIDPGNKKAADFKEAFIKETTEVSLFDVSDFDDLNVNPNTEK